MSDELINALEATTPCEGRHTLVCIDHDTPNSTIAVGAKQRRLIDWAVRNGLALEKCRGVGYLRMLESYVSKDQIIVGTGKHMAGVGAIGALGISVAEEKVKQAVADGFLDICVPEIFSIAITGSPASDVSSQDAALILMSQLNKKDIQGKLIVFSEQGGPFLTMSQRYDFCHMTQQFGTYSAVFTPCETAPSMTFDLGKVMPAVIQPGAVDKISPLDDVASVAVNEVFVGGCRGGKLEDLRAAAAVVRGKKIAYRVRMIVAPATSEIYIQALKEGLIDTFLDFGALVMNQGCSVCWGKAQGILDDGETLVSTGSYNYPGCSGSEKANVYIASPAIAAACAVTGLLQR